MIVNYIIVSAESHDYQQCLRELAVMVKRIIELHGWQPQGGHTIVLTNEGLIYRASQTMIKEIASEVETGRG